MSQEKTWPALVGKGGKVHISPRKLSKSGVSNGDEENENTNPAGLTSSTGGECDMIDAAQAGSPRDDSSSPRANSPRSTSPRSTSPRGASSSSSSSSSSKPKPDLRARALMSHKKMQEQFNPKKSVGGGPTQGGLSLMSGRVTREEVPGRAVAFALDLAESLHGRRPTPAEIRLIADMLRTLRSQLRQGGGGGGGEGRADVVAGNHHDRRPTTAGEGGSDGDGVEEEEEEEEGEENTKKTKTKTKKDKKDKERTEKKDKKDKKKTEKKKDKKDKKEKKAKKQRKSKERNCGEASSSEGSGISGGGSGIDSGRSVEVLGGRLEYTEETSETTTAAGVLSLVTADALKLKDLVHAYLKQALSSLPPPDRSPRLDGHKGHFSWGYEIHAKTDKGVRDVNEDTYVVVEHYNDLFTLKRAPPQIYIGLFDGHSGKEAAEFCRAQLHLAIAQEFDAMEESHEDETTALTAAFLRTDNQFNEKATFMGSNDGTTAMAAFLRGDRLVIANCGDSKALLCRTTPSGETQLLSLCTTQNPNREDEKERVKKAGGTVVWYGTWRVNAVLGVSRSIGDRQLKHIIIPQPEIQITQLTPEDEFMVLATDGLWDYLKEEEVASFVRSTLQTKSREEVCDALIDHVVSGKNGKDNVTVIIVFFDHPSSSSGSSHRSN